MNDLDKIRQAIAGWQLANYGIEISPDNEHLELTLEGDRALFVFPLDEVTLVRITYKVDLKNHTVIEALQAEEKNLEGGGDWVESKLEEDDV